MLNGARCCLPTPIGGSAVRIACLCISPSLPATVALRQRHDLRGHPALIVDHAPGTSRIVDASPAAAGVVAGMTLAAALARCPDAIVLEADAPACRHLFQQVCRAPQGAGDLVRRTGVQPQAARALVEAGPSMRSPPTAGGRSGRPKAPSRRPAAANAPWRWRRRSPRWRTGAPPKRWWGSTGRWGSTPAAT